MTSTANPIRLQSDLKEHVKGEYEHRNTRNGTRIITEEMSDYSAMKSYLEKNNLHYFTFSPNSEKPNTAVFRHFPPDTPPEDISNSLEHTIPAFERVEAFHALDRAATVIGLHKEKKR
jgi:hypothetical protein